MAKTDPVMRLSNETTLSFYAISTLDILLSCARDRMFDKRQTAARVAQPPYFQTNSLMGFY